MLRLYRLSPLRAPGLPLIALLYAAMTVDSARRHYAGRGAEWKGRTDRRPVRLCCVADPNERAQTRQATSLWADDPRTGWRRYHHRRRLHRHPARRQPLAVFPDGARPGRRRDAAHGPGAEPAPRRCSSCPPSTPADVRVRIFTPANELTFAGHPVLGSAFVLGEALGTSALTLETGAGTDTGGTGARPRPDHLRPDGAARPGARAVRGHRRAAGRARRDPVRAAGRGVPQRPRHVYVELPSEAEVAALRPDQRALGHLPIAVSTFAGQGPAWKTRMFSPFHGVPEDPATGSAAGPLAVHLARHGRIGFGEEIEIRQGEEIGRPVAAVRAGRGLGGQGGAGAWSAGRRSSSPAANTASS